MSPFIGDDEFKEEWFGEDEEGNSLHEIGLRGGWDAATRDKELDNDGVTGEVVFPGPDAATGTHGRAVRCRLQPGRHARTPSTCSPARVRTTAGRPSCARTSPERRAGLIVAPILDDLDGAIAEIRRAHADGLTRRHHHPAAVGRPRVVHELPLRPGVGGVRRSSTSRCTATPVPRAHEDYGDVPRLDERLRLRDDLLHRAAAVVHAAHRCVRALPDG